MKKLPLFLAHGSGVGHTTEFLHLLTSTLRSSTNFHSVQPVTFFYMRQKEATGKKRPPPRINVLIKEYQDLVGEADCIVAGKSLGGRVATQLSELANVKAVICFGFPFHPPSQNHKDRLSFLQNMEAPCLIIQGTRDRLGNYEWVKQQTIPDNVEIIWVKDADHDFNTPKTGKTTSETVNELTEACQTWLQKINIL